jgi:MFS family permease
VEGSTAKKAAMSGAGVVLVTLCAAQFLMTLDTSVMNVAIATVAKDCNTTVTGVQTAITLYALVMAALMITGGKIGALIGRKRAFSIGCVIYGAGSLTTSFAHSLNRPDHRVVVPGGCRGGADPSRCRGAGCGQLRG